MAGCSVDNLACSTLCSIASYSEFCQRTVLFNSSTSTRTSNLSYFKSTFMVSYLVLTVYLMDSMIHALGDFWCFIRTPDIWPLPLALQYKYFYSFVKITEQINLSLPLLLSLSPVIKPSRLAKQFLKFQLNNLWTAPKQVTRNNFRAQVEIDYILILC